MFAGLSIIGHVDGCVKKPGLLGFGCFGCFGELDILGVLFVVVVSACKHTDYCQRYSNPLNHVANPLGFHGHDSVIVKWPLCFLFYLAWLHMLPRLNFWINISMMRLGLANLFPTFHKALNVQFSDWVSAMDLILWWFEIV